VKLSGVPLRPLNEALAFLEEEAAKILPQGYLVDYTGESRQLRIEGNKFLPAFMPGPGDDLPHPGGAIQQLPRSLVILAGSVPLAMFGALVFHLSENARSQRALLDRGVDHHAEHLQSGGVGDPGGSVPKTAS
jgi:hypothetical protein